MVVTPYTVVELPPPPQLAMDKAFLRSLSTLSKNSIVTIDFETESIEARPAYPPQPVGVAIQVDYRAPRYLAWYHPSGNNCDAGDAYNVLTWIFKSECRLLFHNAKFDLAVATEKLELPMPAWERLHDTLLLAFLHDPNNRNLSLKPLAEKYLGDPPDERDTLRDWILEHVPGAKRSPDNWGAHIAKAPADRVSPYAKGDVARTYELWALWAPRWDRMGRRARDNAYDRERACIPMLLNMEWRGIPVDVSALQGQTNYAEKNLEQIELWLTHKLGLSGPDQLDKKQAFADALEDGGFLEEWVMTPPTKTHPEGQRSTSIDSLRQVLLDDTLLGALEYRASLRTQLTTFARPWLAVASKHGRIFPIWNQVRQSDERRIGRSIGARTGRLSSTPNVQNIPADLHALRPTKALYEEAEAAGERPIRVPRVVGTAPWRLMDLRACIAAPQGDVLINLDYSQQELRILAHFEAGDLWAAYNENPDLDQHEYARGRINAQLGTAYTRKQIKTVGFALIYAMGLDLLAESLGISVVEAKVLRDQYKASMPGLKALDAACKSEPAIVTWGGRRYEPEPPALAANGGTRTFEYKQLNRLIQGSAADVLKEAMLRYYNDPKARGRIILCVHDEIMLLCKKSWAKTEFNRLTKHMESVELSLRLPASGATGATWRSCK